MTGRPVGARPVRGCVVSSAYDAGKQDDYQKCPCITARLPGNVAGVR